MDTLSQIIRLHEDDDVAIARNTLTAGTVLNELDGLVVRAEIPAAHKVALRDVEAGALVRRYGQTIGRASCRIERGEHVHVHNVSMGDFERLRVRRRHEAG